MKSFREFIFEEYKEIENTGVWKNPSITELQTLPKNVRAFATLYGDLFVISKPRLYHEDLLTIMKRGWPDTKSLVFAALGNTALVSLVRKGTSNLFLVGDDEWHFSKARRSENEMKLFDKNRIAILRLVSKRNKGLSFKYMPIGEG